MSLQLIAQYHTRVERLVQYGGSRNEGSIRSAFARLLEGYASGKNLVLVHELEYRLNGRAVIPDGTLKNAVRQDLGYWESKDEKDDLDGEIAAKFAKGYPKSNILFEDSRQVVLIQNGREVGRTLTDDAPTLHALLSDFVAYEPPFVKTFREAVGRFQQDLPDLLAHLRGVIDDAHTPGFITARDRLLALCQKAINPHLTVADIREMVIQHILTEDIFVSVFNDAQFHRENTIARELQSVTDSFFRGALRKNTLAKIEPYYAVIRSAASNITDHHEKQKFLKVIYERFYKSYNPAGADRLGIVYTPGEIVRFMVESADHLVYRHFGKLLGDPGVNVLDPATGTGTFITDIIEYLPKAQLAHKYRHELFCNEVALLPYYTANLNIEATYQQKMGEYVAFENIAFVDTLDNLGYVGSRGQFSMFELTAENLERIKRQNEKEISVIIGNPPYNANQLNENENNKNRPYPAVDERIKQTYVKASTAQKTKVYDMYARFLRWASDRLGDNGIIAFVSDNSFIDAATFDGFRRCVTEDFSEIYIIDMKGNARTSGERRKREGGNVFSDEIRVGVAIYFLIRKQNVEGCKIYYHCVDDYWRAQEKQAYLKNTFVDLDFKHITPDKNHNWVHQSENEWDNFLPVATAETKMRESEAEQNAIFKLYSLGVSTNRDEWVYSTDEVSLKNKMSYFCDFYESESKRWREEGKDKAGNSILVGDFVDRTIKWTNTLERHLVKGTTLKFDAKHIKPLMHRPFVKVNYYAEKTLSDRLTSNHTDMFGIDFAYPNKLIAVNVSDKPFNVIANLDC